MSETEWGVKFPGETYARVFPSEQMARDALERMLRDNTRWRARRDEKWESPILVRRPAVPWEPVAASGNASNG